MSYGIVLSTEAQHDLAGLPPVVRRLAIKQLRLLQEHPTALSRRSHFPYREKCQLYQFDTDHGLQRWEFSVMFQYGQNEQTIYIIAIGYGTLDIGDGVHLE